MSKSKHFRIKFIYDKDSIHLPRQKTLALVELRCAVEILLMTFKLPFVNTCAAILGVIGGEWTMVWVTMKHAAKHIDFYAM